MSECKSDRILIKSVGFINIYFLAVVLYYSYARFTTGDNGMGSIWDLFVLSPTTSCAQQLFHNKKLNDNNKELFLTHATCLTWHGWGF